MKRVCHTCKILVDAKDFAAHREAHHNASKPRQTGWGTPHAALRRLCIKRDGHRCVVCKRTEEQLRALGLQLHMHHLIDVIDGGPDDLHNVEMRCEVCHRRGRKKSA